MKKNCIENIEIEVPYELPEGWKWVRLGDVCKFENGYAFKADKFAETGIPVIRITNIKENEVDISDCIYSTETNMDEKFVVKKGDLLIAMSGATTGKNGVYLSEEKVYLNQRVGNIKVIDSKILNDKFRNFYIQEKEQEILRNAYGGAQPNISSNKICEMLFPLPPTLEEQQRIVNRIETLFAKLDQAKEKAQNVVDTFETRKASILHKAFTGELTKKWREENNPEKASVYLEKIKNEVEIRLDFKYWDSPHLPDSWCESTIGNLLYFAGRVGWKGLKAEEYTSEGPIFLSVYNLNDGDEISFNKINHISMERYEESPEIMVMEHDILLTKDGAGIGKLGYVNKLPQEATINSSLLLIRPGKVANYKFIFYLLSGPALQSLVKERITGSATPHLFQRDIKEFCLPVPTLSEQTEIVRILDYVLEKETKAKEAAEAVLEQIDLLKKSILARAFRGEV